MEKRSLGIYVHIPFCVRKCDYCDFPSGVSSPEEQAYYIRVLLKEIRGFEALSNLYRVDTVFLGGGTPTILEISQLERIMSLLREQYEFSPDCEMTIEGNPGTLTEEKLRAYRSLGFNRLSMGLQSVHRDELACLGRIHSYEEFLESYRLARQVGFSNINVDLMSALPNQSVESWRETLEKVSALQPEHISAYSLIIEEGTPFYRRYMTEEGQRELPDEETDRQMYRMTREILGERGYHRYEISNYAREGLECRHNLTYWTGGEYVGFGLGAASYLDGRRFANPKDKAAYWDYARTAYQRYRAMPAQEKKAMIEEYLFLGLRTMQGISTRAFEEKFHVSFRQIYGQVTDALIEEGLLEENPPYLRLTDWGVDVSNQVLVHFLLP